MSKLKVAGFTLIEVLIAMFILAVSAGAVMTLMSQSAAVIPELEGRFYTQLVAHNVMVDLALEGISENPNVLEGTEELANLSFPWRANISGTSDNDLLRVQLAVKYPMDGEREYTLTAFPQRSTP